LSGNAKVYLVDESNKFRPFVNGGVGAYVTDSATTHFGGNVGGGVLYEVTPNFGIQGSYNFHIFSAGYRSQIFNGSRRSALPLLGFAATSFSNQALRHVL
jgi:hypothetical protein